MLLLFYQKDVNIMLKEEFDYCLDELGLDRKTFAELTQVSYNTITNWNDNKKPIPSWVHSWLDNYKKAKALDDIAKEISPYLEKK